MTCLNGKQLPPASHNRIRHCHRSPFDYPRHLQTVSYCHSVLILIDVSHITAFDSWKPMPWISRFHVFHYLHFSCISFRYFEHFSMNLKYSIEITHNSPGSIMYKRIWMIQHYSRDVYLPTEKMSWNKKFWCKKYNPTRINWFYAPRSHWNIWSVFISDVLKRNFIENQW